MATFPGGVVALTNPTANDTLAAVPHHTQHGNANDEIEAIETFLLGGAVNVLSHGAVADGVTDCTAAFQAAITAAASGSKAVYVPSGRYFFPDTSASLDLGTGDMDIFGDGMHRSILLWEEGTNDDPHPVFLDAQLGSQGGPYVNGHRSFRDLGFQGTWSASPARRGLAAIFMVDTESVTVSRCRFYDQSVHGVAVLNGGRLSVTDCDFERIAIGMVFTRAVPNVRIVGNTFKNGDDNVLTISQGSIELAANDNLPVEGYLVVGNIFEDVANIDCRGARVAKFADNVFRRCKLGAIFVATRGVPSESEGVVFAISITGNQIVDLVNWGTGSQTFPQAGILVTGEDPSGDTDNDGVIPGENNTGTGAFTRPYAFRENQTDIAGESMPPPFHIIVSDNSITRTLPAVSAYSDWGFGQQLRRDGWYDGAVTDENMRAAAGVQIAGDARVYRVTDNILDHTKRGVNLVAPTTHFGSSASAVSDNTIRDFSEYGIVILGAFSTKVAVARNIIDGDPYHDHANRAANGKWTADTTPFAIYAPTAYGVVYDGNLISNVCNSIRYTAPSYVIGNVLYCDPDTTGGFHADNAGIGDIPTPGRGFTIVTTECDPTSADYGRVTAVPNGSNTGQVWVPAVAMWPSTTNGATALATFETTTNKQNVRYLSFPDSGITYAETTVAMPVDWDAGTITATVYATCLTSGFFNLRFAIEARAYSDEDDLDQAWGTAVGVNLVQLTSSYPSVQSRTSAAITPAGTLVPGQVLHLRVSRDPGDAADNLNAASQLLGIRIDYTRV